MATIYFTGGLTQYTDGVESLTVDVGRVRELLEAVTDRFPALTEPIALMSIAVDGEIHQHPDYLPLSSSSEVYLLPRISGGASVQ